VLSGITISGFTVSGDTIDVTDLAFSGNTSVGFDSGTDILTVNEGGNSATIQLDSEDYTSISWVAGNDAGSGTNVMVACFLRGTLILTDHGEVPVEELAIGDAVMTRSGAVKPVRWIGRRSYDGRFIAGNRAVLPIRVAAGALGERVPARDLWLSPEHALAIDDALVPAVQLVNGLTITQAHAVEWLQYFHIERRDTTSSLPMARRPRPMSIATTASCSRTPANSPRSTPATSARPGISARRGWRRARPSWVRSVPRCWSAPSASDMRATSTPNCTSLSTARL